MTDWHDLPDDEVLARFLQRGVPDHEAVALVQARDSEQGIGWINFYLGTST